MNLTQYLTRVNELNTELVTRRLNLTQHLTRYIAIEM